MVKRYQGDIAWEKKYKEIRYQSTMNLKKGVLIGLLTIILLILSIITYTQNIIGIPSISEWTIFDSLFDDEQVGIIEIIFEPEQINEGQYENIPITITIPNVQENNISYLELKQNNVIVVRENKNEQTDVATIRWIDMYNPETIILYKGGSSKELKAVGQLLGCINCFMGEDFPYKITFTVHYKINGGEIEVSTIEKIIPLK